MSYGDTERWNSWRDYLNNDGQTMTRGELGHRILEARTAGYNNAQIAEMLGRSVGYVSSLAALVSKLDKEK